MIERIPFSTPASSGISWKRHHNHLLILLFFWNFFPDFSQIGAVKMALAPVNCPNGHLTWSFRQQMILKNWENEVHYMKTCQTILTEVIWGDWPLFVFSENGPKQNARLLMTPVSDTDFSALLPGSPHFVLHRSSNNRLSIWKLLIGSKKILTNKKCSKKLPWKAKPRLPCEISK